MAFAAGMEFVGEVFADFFGLNQSKFQWIIDIKQREDEAIARRAARRAARERQRAAAHDTRLEEGDTDRKVDLHEA